MVGLANKTEVLHVILVGIAAVGMSCPRSCSTASEQASIMDVYLLYKVYLTLTLRRQQVYTCIPHIMYYGKQHQIICKAVHVISELRRLKRLKRLKPACLNGTFCRSVPLTSKIS